MKFYEYPETELVKFAAMDVVATSETPETTEDDTDPPGEGGIEI